MIQLAQRIGGYVTDIRTSKEPLQLDTIIGFLQEITSDARKGTDLAPWDVVAGFVAGLGQEAAVILPTMMEQENVLKGQSPSSLITLFLELRPTSRCFRRSRWNLALVDPSRTAQRQCSRQRRGGEEGRQAFGGGSGSRKGDQEEGESRQVESSAFPLLAI